MEWWINLLKVLGKVALMVVLTPVMRLRYWIDPSARKKDIDAMTKSGKFEITEDNRKYWMASDPNNLDEFMWTWKQISTMIKTEFQNLNKTAKLYSSSPNPELYDPESGDTKHLLSVAAKSVPLVVNFGSCT